MFSINDARANGYHMQSKQKELTRPLPYVIHTKKHFSTKVL